MTTTTRTTATTANTTPIDNDDNHHHVVVPTGVEAHGNRRPPGGFPTTTTAPRTTRAAFLAALPYNSDDDDDDTDDMNVNAEPASMDSTVSLASFPQRIPLVDHDDDDDDDHDHDDDNENENNDNTEESSDDKLDRSTKPPSLPDGRPTSVAGHSSVSRSLSFSTMDLQSLRKSSWTADRPSPRPILRVTSGHHEAWHAKWRSAHSKLARLSRDLKKWEEARRRLPDVQPITQRYHVCQAEVHVYARKMLCMLRVLENHARKFRAHGQPEQADALLQELLPQPDKYRERLQHLFDHTKFPTARSWVELSENSRRFKALLDSVRTVLCPDTTGSGGVPFTMTTTTTTSHRDRDRDRDDHQQAKSNALTALAEASYRLERLERDLKQLQRAAAADDVTTTAAAKAAVRGDQEELESAMEFWRHQVDTMLDGKWCPKDKPPSYRIEENDYGLGAFDIGKSHYSASAPASAPLPISSSSDNRNHHHHHHYQRPPGRRYYVGPSGEVWSK